MSKKTILAVDDEENMRLSLKAILEEEHYSVALSGSGSEALSLLKKHPVDLVITDAKMPEIDGYQLLGEVKRNYSDIPVILITAYATPELAVKAIKSGAYDYISKPFDPDEILFTIKRALEHYDMQKENLLLKNVLEKQYTIENIIGNNILIEQIKEKIHTVAPTGATVLIEGESGTGKELVAHSIHSLSQVKDGPFVAVNCAALPEPLLESELFGHEKGAFTGAYQAKKGKFEISDKGTIYLDEIGDMSLSLQAKILRVLERREFERVGGTKVIGSDVRIIAATNKNLNESIKNGEFREDLYYRLNVINIHLPPLRERKDDISLLSNFFLSHYNAVLQKSIKGFSQKALEILEHHTWPGNVRELKNCIERSVILTQDDYIEGKSIELHKKHIDRDVSITDKDFLIRDTIDYRKTVSEYEKKLITWALSKSQNRIQKAATILGISRHSLRHHIKRLKITIE